VKDLDLDPFFISLYWLLYEPFPFRGSLRFTWNSIFSCDVAFQEKNG